LGGGARHDEIFRTGFKVALVARKKRKRDNLDIFKGVASVSMGDLLISD